ncbi:MAG: carbohydrate ABC transporter permease [Microcella sp.]|uniref:carbohydrate ABC transporter permease n=1 Tax=Microcella sp. TaxID=1913979 RepID=UPI0033152365
MMLFPFAWQVLTSFKTLDEAIRVPIVIWPAEWQFENYGRALTAIPFFDMLNNSVVSVVVRSFFQVLLCSLAGYAFAVLRFPFKNLLFIALLAIMMVPRELYLLPQTEILKVFGWLNTVPGLIAPGIVSAFGVFLMRQFFLSMPSSLVEAAKIDGASHLRIWFSIMLPLARPGISALIIFTALFSWNELLWPLLVNSDADKLNLSAGLSTLSGDTLTDFPLMMAGAVMAQLPMIIAFLILQKSFIQGIAFTGTK